MMTDQSEAQLLKDLKEVLQRGSKRVAGASKGQSQSFAGVAAFSPRNTHDEVYPNLFLGNEAFSRDLATLRQLKITHILNCSMGKQFAQVDTSADYYSELDVMFYGIPAKDTANFRLSEHFRSAADFIAQALARGGRVAVHCHMGMSRSAAVLLAYLMLEQGMPLLQAAAAVSEKRYIFPNDGFCKQLVELELATKVSGRSLNETT